VLVAVNLSGTGASTQLNLEPWQGQRVRELLWGCDFPEATGEWFVYLPAYGFGWWLLGDAELSSSSRPDASAVSRSASA
jgi:maltose alpha-D-glucosyltransferase/alpha-amylase